MPRGQTSTSTARLHSQLVCFPTSLTLSYRELRQTQKKRSKSVVSLASSSITLDRIAEWASARGRDVGLFTQTTLEEYAKTSNEKFDIVLSLGFIEHFNNFCGVIFDHATLCKTGGTVIIGAPNFASPIQRALHRVLDKDNLSNHVLETMYPKV